MAATNRSPGNDTGLAQLFGRLECAVDDCACSGKQGGGGADYAIGVGVAVFGAFVLATGMVGMRVGLLRVDAKPVRPRFGPFCEPIWLAAFAAFSIGNGAEVVAVTFAPQSVIAPLGSSAPRRARRRPLAARS